MLYYRKSLKVIHLPDLEEDKVEGICLQVKAGSRDTLTKSKQRILCSVSKTSSGIKFSNTLLFGDFNSSNFLQDEHGEYPTKETS